MLQVVALAGLLALVACGGSGPSGPVNNPPPTNYAGNWSGTYTVSSCTNTGFFADAALCSAVMDTTAAVSFALTQSGRAVSGTFTLGSLTSSSFTATVGSDESLVLTAVVTESSFTIDATWTLQQAVAGALTGQTRQVWRASGQSGDGVIQGAIVSAARTNAVRLFQSVDREPAVATLQQLVDAVRAARTP